MLFSVFGFKIVMYLDFAISFIERLISFRNVIKVTLKSAYLKNLSIQDQCIHITVKIWTMLYKIRQNETCVLWWDYRIMKNWLLLLWWKWLDKYTCMQIVHPESRRQTFFLIYLFACSNSQFNIVLFLCFGSGWSGNGIFFVGFFWMIFDGMKLIEIWSIWIYWLMLRLIWLDL